MTHYLDFEKPLAEIEGKAEELRAMARQNEDMDIEDEAKALDRKAEQLLNELYQTLTPWRKCQIARHPERPHCQDYIDALFTEFTPLAGDRNFADDHAVVGGLARFNDTPVIGIGHEKGNDTKSRIERNFGMARPEGYRKALRLMEMAERFNLPIITFIDTPGAYPGVGAEERGQSEAIAKNLKVMAELSVPIICTVIGEGGSGGALAIGVGDRVNMLQYSTYSVISPEGCASILWKDASKAAQASESMAMVAPRLLELKLIDHVFNEPLGGSHRNTKQMAEEMKKGLQSQITSLQALSSDALIERRYQRLMSQSYNQIACDNWGGW